jgi:hypothetical protein
VVQLVVSEEQEMADSVVHQWAALQHLALRQQDSEHQQVALDPQLQLPPSGLLRQAWQNQHQCQLQQDSEQD